jgi:hypothetical protein
MEINFVREISKPGLGFIRIYQDAQTPTLFGWVSNGHPYGKRSRVHWVGSEADATRKGFASLYQDQRDTQAFGDSVEGKIRAATAMWESAYGL